MDDSYIIVNPNNKTGIKTLTKDQLRIGLPAIDVLEDRIEDIRRNVETIDRKILSEEIFESLKYDQIFSLIGGRGAGKTSILLTLYNKFKLEDCNIVLPIIMPELIDDDENIISWLLSAIEKNLGQIEDKIKGFGNNNKSRVYNDICKDYKLFDRCSFNKNNMLRQKFDELKSGYYSKEVKVFGTSYPENREYKAISEESSFSLMQRFVDYWNALIDVYSKYLAEKNQEKNPLIFIFIDDADLKPQIINELLFVIPKYLSHPNIVVFISAAHKTLTYAVKNYMYKSLVQTPFDLPKFMEVEYLYNGNTYKNNNGNIVKYHDLKYGKEYDKIKRLSDEILRKLFPVYNRYYLKKYDRYEEKRLLQIFETENPDCKNSISLSKKMAILIADFCESIYDKHKKYSVSINGASEPTDDTLDLKFKNFHLLDDYNAQKQIDDMDNDYYLSFLGQYPRDIVAVYYALKDMLDNMQHKLQDLYENKYDTTTQDKHDIPILFLQHINEIIIKFLSCAIASNRKLSVFSKYLTDLVKPRLLHWQLFVDYAKVIEIFKDSKYFNNNQKDVDAFVEMITLLNFVEQFIVLIMPQRKRSNGYREFMSLMDLSEIKMIRCDCELNLMLKQYYEYHSLRIVPNFSIESSEHQANFLLGAKKLNIFYKYQENAKENKYRKYPLEWFEFVSQVAVKRFTCVGRIKDYKDELRVIDKYSFIGENYQRFYQKYYQVLKDIIFKEEKSTLVPIQNNRIVYEMEKNVIALNLIIENAELEVANKGLELKDNIELYGNQLDYIENKRIKREVASLITYIYSGNTIKRNVVISKMNSIKYLIDADNEDYMALSVWFVGFERLLEEIFKVKDDEGYQKFEDILNKIDEEYGQYIKYYYSIIFNDVNKEKDKINVQYMDINVLGEEVESLIQIAKEREWNSFIEME